MGTNSKWTAPANSGGKIFANICTNESLNYPSDNQFSIYKWIFLTFIAYGTCSHHDMFHNQLCTTFSLSFDVLDAGVKNLNLKIVWTV